MTTAKAALQQSLPDIKNATRKAHVAALVSSAHLDSGYELKVADGLAGDELAETVLSAFPSLGY
jgi:hypothetical protein